MSEQQTEQTQPDSATATRTDFPLAFFKQETGRTHTVVTNGVQSTVPIVHGETGEPEAEYVLAATIDGVEVPLATYNAGRIETIVSAGKSSQQQAQ